VFAGVIKPSYLWLQEQAKKALESALGGKKDEFEKWNKEIKMRFSLHNSWNAVFN